MAATPPVIFSGGTSEYDNHWKRAYSSRVLSLSQFRVAKTIAMCQDHGTISGEREYIDVIGESVGGMTDEVGGVLTSGGFTQVTSRHGRRLTSADAFEILPDDWELDRTRRRFDRYDIAFHYYWDEKDASRMMRSIGPHTEEASNCVGMYQKEVEDYIIYQMHGNAFGGDAGDTSTAFGAGLATADHTFEAAAAQTDAITIDKLLDGCAALQGRDVPDESMGVEWCVLIHPVDLHQLFKSTADERVTSADYSAVRALIERKLTYYLGMHWIVSSRVPQVTTLGGGAQTGRYVTIVPKTAMGFKTGMGLRTRIEQIALRRYSHQVYYDACISATRLHEDQMYRIECTLPATGGASA